MIINLGNHSKEMDHVLVMNFIVNSNTFSSLACPVRAERMVAAWWKWRHAVAYSADA